ncbi:glycoside hydrolase family 15 protein [Kitasatospora sp. NPDC098663]|uniref:glycoside hydrolase family 15 protein n=1 Tax=Kitasatospora sp. NPDC098663 TaxID=3364096 RepID=UPI00380A725B
MPSTSVPAPLIEDHALIGNARSAALVTRDGSLDWLCLPRFDSPAVFAALLGSQEHGLWRVGPAGYDGAPPVVSTRRRYRGESLVLEQEWDTPDGSVRVTDFMPAPDDTGHAPAEVIRIVEGLSGQVRVASEFRPRPGYGAQVPVIRRAEQHGQDNLDAVGAVSGTDAYWLRGGPRHSPGRHGTCRADFPVAAGQRVVLTLTWQEARHHPPAAPDTGRALGHTLAFWHAWSSSCTYTGPEREAVVRCALTLKAMCHVDGGTVAAPTTSLPERLGGERNWDYRFTWLRDSALTVSCLLRLGFVQEAGAWRDWLTSVVDPANLRALYRLSGATDTDEEILDHLPGYENSRPVRIGNAAAGQVQLDVYGELADALLLADDAGLPRDRDADELLLALAEQLERRWREPDEGIWEVRGPRRHFTHSKVMSWVFFDRAATLLARRRGTGLAVARLRAVREEIHADVCAHGIDPERGVFTQYYGSRDLDASLLLIPVVGFLPGDDKRVIATVEAVQRELATPDGLVLRYRTGEGAENVDGLRGHEGAFLACSFWLADALTMIGRDQEARDLVDRLLALRNDLGLLAEEYDPLTRRQLGNFPQAFSMWALADSCRALSTFSARADVSVAGSRIPCPESVSDVQPAQNSLPTHEPAGEAALQGT